MLQIKNVINAESDERYRYLLMNGFLKKTIKGGNIIIIELRQIPNVWVCYRRPQERKESLERLELNSMDLTHLPLFEGEEKLKMLTLQNNRISKIENLISLNSLVYLDLYNNGIKEI
jgi:leucine-rich repeat-containing protein 49